MNKLSFSLLFLLSIFITAQKAWFFWDQTKIQDSLIGWLDIGIMLTLLGWAIISFATTSKTQLPKITLESFKTPNVALLTLGILTLLGISFLRNSQKVVLDWDTIALYDARAQFMLAGSQFSEMKEYGKYDIQNGYYYLLYPPFTSVIHYSWYQSGISLPVSLFYALCLLLLTLGIFLITSSKLGVEWALITCFLVIGQQSLFATSLVAYTNLPYTLYLSLGILALHRYLLDKHNWWLALGIVLVSSSQWIRFLEPSWIAVVTAFVLVGWKVMGIKKAIFSSLLFILACGIGYLAWKYFADVVSQKEAIFQTSWPFLLEPVVGIFTGSFLQIFVAYVRMWGSIMIMYVASVVSILNDLKESDVGANLFLVFTILGSFSMYFVGLYFISFQFLWWPEMAGSLLRSSTFLLPAAIYLLSKTVKTLLKQ